MKSSRLDRTLAILLVVSLVSFSILSQTIDAGSEEAIDGSVASTKPSGRRALYLMLDELGFGPEAWRQVPGVLPRGDHVLWLARAPEPWTKAESDETRNERAGDESPGDETARDETAREERAREESDREESAAEDETSQDAESEPARDTTPAALDLHALVHYRSFLEEGGTLVIEQGEATERFLADVLGLEGARRSSLVPDAPAGRQRVRTAAGEELEAEWSAGSVFADLDPGDSAREVWFGTRQDGTANEAEHPLAVVLPVANGRVVLLGDDGFLDNARIGSHDHALLAIRLLEELAPSGRLLFDEYALGAWETPSVVDLALSAKLALVTLHLALVLALFVWRIAWVRGFPRDPQALERVSPLARARALASLLVRARRYDLLADDLRRAVLARLRARARLTTRRTRLTTRRTQDVSRSSDDATLPAVAAEKRASDERELAAIAARLGRLQDLERWREVVLTRPVRDEAAFDALGSDLARIERDVEAAGPAGSRPAEIDRAERVA